MKLQGFFASDVQFYIALTASYSFFRNNPDTLQVNRLTVYYCKSETCSDNNSYTPTKWFILPEPARQKASLRRMEMC